MIQNQKLQAYFDNWKLLRANMYLEMQDFRRKNKNKYPNKVLLERALRTHINRMFRKDSEVLEQMHEEILANS
jgi:hypothetical protein